MVLKKGYGLLAFALIGAATTYSNALIFWMLLRLDRYGHYRFRREDVSKHSLIELFRFGSKVLLLGIAEMVSSASAPIVIGVFLSPVALTFYAIPSNLLKYIYGIISSITIIYMPFFSDLHARQDKNRSIQTFESSSRYVIALALLFLGGVLFLGASFLRIWMGAEYAEKGKWVLSVLVFAYLTGFINPFAGRFLTGIGRLEVVVKYVWCLAATNIILSVVLIGSQGITGVALGSAIAGAIFQPAILALTLRHVGMKFRDYARNVLLPLVGPFLILCIALFLLIRSIEPESYFDILCIAGSSTALYLAALWSMALRNDERSVVNQFVKCKLKRVLAH
jgi:O-antigen/teichoic acid export membrane protein